MLTPTYVRAGGAVAAWTPPSGLRGPIWYHGASAGEVRSLTALAAQIAARTGLDGFITTRTADGVAMATHLGWGSRACPAPVDLPGPAGRFAQASGARLLAVEASELWPALFRAAERGGMPVVIVNGNLSPQKLPAYRLLLRAFPALRHAVAGIFARDSASARAFEQAGYPGERIHVTGDPKLDATDWALAPAAGPHGPIVFGSIASAEFEFVTACVTSLRALGVRNPAALVPRHPADAGRLQAFLARQTATGEVHIETRMGTLPAWYRRAAVAVVCGTFSRRGGQNVYEPAAMGVPTLYGPCMHRQASMAALLADAGLPPAVPAIKGCVAPGASATLAQVIWCGLTGWDAAHVHALAVRERLAAHRGALARNAEALAGILAGPSVQVRAGLE